MNGYSAYIHNHSKLEVSKMFLKDDWINNP